MGKKDRKAKGKGRDAALLRAEESAAARRAFVRPPTAAEKKGAGAGGGGEDATGGTSDVASDAASDKSDSIAQCDSSDGFDPADLDLSEAEEAGGGEGTVGGSTSAKKKEAAALRGGAGGQKESEEEAAAEGADAAAAATSAPTTAAAAAASSLAAAASAAAAAEGARDAKRIQSGMAWGELHLCRKLVRSLMNMKLFSPTHIQKEAIPVALQGKDVLGTAETGQSVSQSVNPQMLRSRKDRWGPLGRCLDVHPDVPAGAAWVPAGASYHQHYRR
eukprot:GHVU01117999.1.p1 GENE.GHVU01117999.1~~GHVU01117999.1.p1  ORF type:complete len:275 (+),score=75.52 GHVU01117999.1:90-914(+)